jgi:hypothetical protein
MYIQANIGSTSGTILGMGMHNYRNGGFGGYSRYLAP